MKSILIGSIGVLTECSEIQRRAFNEAFKDFGLDWYWNVANYVKMLDTPGGIDRIIKYSNLKFDQNIANKIHSLKIKYFDLFSKDNLKPRDGILDVINYAHNNDIKLGFITTTNEATLNLVMKNLSKFIDFSQFDLITYDKFAKNKKPDPDIYNYTIEKLKLTPKTSLAIENTLESCNSSIQANLYTLFYPGEYSLCEDNSKTIKNIFEAVKSFFEGN